VSEDFARMALELETERLRMRLWQKSDAVWYRDLVAERGGDVPTLEAARDKVVAARDGAFERGIALLAVERKGEGDSIGYCGLTVGRSTLSEPEIAYELFRRVHGHGYATEAASRVVDAARATGRDRLWATTRPWNVASLRVLAKLSFERHHNTWDERGEVVWCTRAL
jgi:RimJ/RimL family protein N-acetyltransferase